MLDRVQDQQQARPWKTSVALLIFIFLDDGSKVRSCNVILEHPCSGHLASPSVALHQIPGFRPATLESSKSQYPPLTASCGRQIMHHVPLCFSNNFLQQRINVDRFLFLILPLSLYYSKGLLTTLCDTLNTLAMSFCFIPALLMAILQILSSFFFVYFSNIHVLRLFHDSSAEEIHFCISTTKQYCFVSFSFMDRSE